MVLFHGNRLLYQRVHVMSTRKVYWLSVNVCAGRAPSQTAENLEAACLPAAWHSPKRVWQRITAQVYCILYGYVVFVQE